jgi:hypothetical protein
MEAAFRQRLEALPPAAAPIFPHVASARRLKFPATVVEIPRVTMPKIPFILATAIVSVRVTTFALRLTGAEDRPRSQLIAFTVVLAVGLITGVLILGGR